MFRKYFLSVVFVISVSGGQAVQIERPFQPTTEILLIRHGETDWNLEDRLQGVTDNPLNAKGIAQAEKLAEKMLKYHSDIALTMYSSNLQRAFATAEKTREVFTSAGYCIGPIVKDPDLREFQWGAIEGMTVSERIARYSEYQENLEIEYPDRRDRWNYPLAPEEGVETLNHLVERTKRAIGKIAAAHPGEKVAVFVHGRVINTLIIDSTDENVNTRKSLPNCAVVHFYYHPESDCLEFIEVENLLDAKCL